MILIQNIKHFFRKRRKINIFEKKFKKKEIKSVINIDKVPINFNSSSNPRVAIIIPFFNQIDYTINCLNYLNNNLTNKISFEIILIDDNSPDDCDLSFISGIKIIKNESNQGFLKNINIGVKAANAEYIYILNNDTEVRKGFLDELFYVFDSFPNVGAVGSKLINADGTLQEAGSVFMKDCTIHQIVQRKEVYFPQVNYINKVDYCSGCSLLYKKYDDFGNINLFDEQFAPAYFEETDFCFQLKYLQNKNVYYTSFSEVLHYNGVSYNAPKNNDEYKIKQKEELFKINLQKFKNKWQPQIDAIQATNVELRIEELYEGKEVVIFCGTIPEYDKDSGSNRLKEIILAFIDLGYYVSIIRKKTFLGENNYIEYYERLGVNVYYEHKKSIGVEKYIKKNNSNASLAWFYGPDVFMEYHKMAKKYLLKAKLVYDMVDIHHLRFKRAIELEPKRISFRKKFLKYKRIESKASKIADFVITISDFEESYMKQFCNENKIITISNIHYIKTELKKTFSFEERKDIVFIGSGHTPNLDALYFLYNEIMPIVWKTNPEIKVNVVGNVKDYIKDINNPNFIFHGFVSEIDNLFFENKLMVAPLRYGAGVKGKIGQAFEYFLPVVTTSIGSEGMRLTNNENALINDDAIGFANAILELYSNKELWQKLQDNSEKSLEPFSISKLKAQINRF